MKLNITQIPEIRPNQDGWFYETGTGPTLINKVYSVATTGIQAAIGRFYPYEYKENSDPAIRSMQKRVANGGAQLGGNDVYKFIEEISRNSPVNHMTCFYFQAGVSIQTLTLNEIKQNIDQASKHFNLTLPICIPINFGAFGVFERNHIASIIIKDNVVDYNDSKGVLSKNKPLKDDHNLQDILEYCREKFTNEGDIAENPYIHQYDCHNCGVFVCRHIYSKIHQDQLMGTMDTNAPSLGEIQNFRVLINQIAYEGEETAL